MIKKAVIAAPFGVYYAPSWATPTRGTYTINPRSGVILQSLKTFRPIKGGWVNRMGFRNPGIKSELSRMSNPQDYVNSTIWSIGAIDSIDDWEKFLSIIPNTINYLEINDSCPNVLHINIPPDILAQYTSRYQIIVKLSANINTAIERFEYFNLYGVKIFNCCNTIPTERGGESSRRIQEVSLPLIKRIKSLDSSNVCIGSGGIYDVDDIKKYRDVGTDHFSLATGLLMPWRISRIKKEIYRNGV